MYRLIAIDLDGTLLGPDKRISSVDEAAVQYAIDKGIKVVICSGRIFAGAKIFARQLKVNAPVIACNGAIVKDLGTEKVLYSKPVAKNDCIDVINICKAEGIYFHVYAGDTLITESLSFSSLFYSERNKELREEDRIRIQHVHNAAEALICFKDPVYKIVAVSNDTSQLHSVRSIVGKIQGIEATSSNYDNFEVQRKGVNKGEALKYMAEMLGIKREEVISIGDNENDLSMLSFAGLGIAMGNAEAEIKRISRHITKTNEEYGVAEAIKLFL